MGQYLKGARVGGRGHQRHADESLILSQHFVPPRSTKGWPNNGAPLWPHGHTGSGLFASPPGLFVNKIKLPIQLQHAVHNKHVNVLQSLYIQYQSSTSLVEIRNLKKVTGK